jgi:hypothetical protein
LYTSIEARRKNGTSETAPRDRRMARRVIFTVRSPLGYRVVLTRNRWREIVRFKHPALAERESEVRETIRNPEVIRASNKDAEVHLHYRGAESGYICVVVGGTEASEGFVITAYLTSEIKKGQALWTR